MPLTPTLLMSTGIAERFWPFFVFLSKSQSYGWMWISAKTVHVNPHELLFSGRSSNDLPAETARKSDRFCSREFHCVEIFSHV